MKFKFVPRVWARVGFVALLAIAFALFQGRKHPGLRIHDALGLPADFYAHISNFSISYMIYAGAGFVWLQLGVAVRVVLAFGTALLLANVVYELWLPVLNTPDVVDAYYGIAGTLLALTLLLLVRRYGLRPRATGTSTTAAADAS